MAGELCGERSSGDEGSMEGVRFSKGLIEYQMAGVGGESSGERLYCELRLDPLPTTVART